MERKGKEQGLLSGTRILDLADSKASFCTKLLAELGAYVIKVEKPGGDASRWEGPFIGDSPDPEGSLPFFYNNRNKLGITLDIQHPEGRALLLKLVAQSDVVVESFPPCYLGSLGLEFEVLRETSPRLVMVSVTGFGSPVHEGTWSPVIL